MGKWIIQSICFSATIFPSFHEINCNLQKMKNLLSSFLAIVLLALVAAGIDTIFKIGTLGNAPFWKGLVYYLILFALIEVVRIGIQRCIDKRESKKQ